MRDTGLELALWRATLVMRKALGAFGIAGRARPSWRGVELAFSAIPGEVSATRTFRQGRWTWILAGKDSPDPDQTVRLFRECARVGAHTFMYYRWHTGASQDLVDCWLNLVVNGDGSAGHATERTNTVLASAVEASRRSAARLRRE